MSNATETVVTYQEARTYIATLEARERKRIGIRTLKVGWNEAQGYYIEITNAAIASRHRDDPQWMIPSEYVLLEAATQRHILRFTTPELIMHETIVMAGE